MKVRKLIILLLSGALLYAFSSCRIIRPSEMLRTNKDYPISTFEAPQQEYVLKPYDNITLRVSPNIGETYFLGSATNATGSTSNSSYQHNRQGFTFPIEFDGQIKLPVLGRIPIAGKTIRDAETYLEELYGEYFQNPFVLLSVDSRKVMIFMNSGTTAKTIYLPVEHLTLIEAIAQIGGLSSISKSHKIKLIRGDLSNNPKIYYWNISTINDLQGVNCYLEANDIIYIDSKPQYITRALREITPYLTAATTVLTIYGVFFKFKGLGGN